MANDDQKTDTPCPLPNTHSRLKQAHILWHQSLDSYHDAERFRANLNSTLEALRNVTFMLQSEKSSLPDFDAWYTTWQDRLKNDPLSKWAHAARTVIVHQQDLDSFSTAEIRLVTSRQKVLAKMNVPITSSDTDILARPDVQALLAPYEKLTDVTQDAALVIERQWSTEELKGKELLEALAHSYGLLADIVLDAHSLLRTLSCIDSGNTHGDFPMASDRTDSCAAW